MTRKSLTKLKRISLLFLICAACSSFAAQIELQFPNEAEREVWVLPSKPHKMPVGGQVFKTKSVPITVADKAGDSYVVVLDKAAGNVAMRQVSAIAGAWNVKPQDWRVAQVDAQVFARGNPMPGGTVEATSGDYDEEQPIESGKATFFAVPAKEVQFVAHYTSGGAKKKSPPQKALLELRRAEIVPKVNMTVDDNVDGPTGAAGQETKKAESKSGGSFIANLLIWLFGLGIAAAALWFLLQQMRKNEAVVAEKLRKLGVQIPGDPLPDDDVAAAQAEPFKPPPLVPEGHCQYCGQPFAADGTCACQVGAPRQAVAAISSQPKLIGDGIILEISDGTTSLGREGILTISDPTISRKHAQVRRESGHVFLSDTGSSNGTFVNGAKIDAEIELHPGDTVQFGAVKFRYEA